MMRHRLLLLCLLLQCCIAAAQTRKALPYAGTIPLKRGYALIFLTKEKSVDLYQQPRIRTGNALKKIEGFGDNNFSSKHVKLSPDGRYVTVESIIKGYVHRSETDSVLHENYGCVIVDLKRARVVQYMQSACDGAWNKQNEWISGGTIIFSKDEQ